MFGGFCDLVFFRLMQVGEILEAVDVGREGKTNVGLGLVLSNCSV